MFLVSWVWLSCLYNSKGKVYSFCVSNAKRAGKSAQHSELAFWVQKFWLVTSGREGMLNHIYRSQR
jgi:hypothetical protein